MESERRKSKRDEIRLKDKIRWVAEKRIKSAARNRENYLKNREDRILKAKENYILRKTVPAVLKKTRGITLEDLGTSAEDYFAKKEARERSATIENSVLRETLRSRVRSALNFGSGRGATILLGADIVFVKTAIESKFTDGMSWENHGIFWHIDHHVPLSHFDLSDHSQREVAFNWRNLRPLTAKENLSKNAKLPDDFVEVKRFIESEIKTERLVK